MSSDDRIRLFLSWIEVLNEHRDFGACDICMPIVTRCCDAECDCPELLTCPEYRSIRATLEGVLCTLNDSEIDMTAQLQARHGGSDDYPTCLANLQHAATHLVAMTIQ